MNRAAACLLLILPVVAGCAGRGDEELSSRVARLEGELAEARARLEEHAAIIGALRQQAEQNEAALDALTAELVTVKVERDKLKQEVAALRRQRR